jgi:NhaA family Na+:H+ antiporter
MRFGNLFQEFFNSEKSGGFILLGCTLVSLFIANSAWGEGYVHFWHQQVGFSLSNLHLTYSIEHWINDGLMTVFFLLVGLEIERELYAGELKEFRNALLPIGAAIGGMLVPALFHYFLNRGTDTSEGFGIPMATDIAFALGMLALMGNRIPLPLKVFLTALAIIDDLGAIAIIAIFYNTGIAWAYLLTALGIFAGLLLLNRLRVHRLVFYIVPGIVMWYCMLQSGVHATITGVLLAFAIPFTRNDDENPSYKLQHALHAPVAYFIIPLFALANTGLFLTQGWMGEMTNRNSLGIITGLFLGKPIGILLFCFLFIRLKWAELPPAITWKHLTGAGLLAGIGFTMSIFISNLAFRNASLVQFSKLAVLVGSLLAVIAGLAVLSTAKRDPLQQ